MRPDNEAWATHPITVQQRVSFSNQSQSLHQAGNPTSGALKVSNKTWNVGIIGCGSVVQMGHQPTFSMAVDNCQVVAICDVQEERVTQFAAERGIPSTYTDYQEMLNQEDLDLVVVAVPNIFHKPMSIAALEAGANVLCEKPVALTLADAQEMFETADKAGRTLTVGTHYRWSTTMRMGRKAVDSGQFGNIYHIRTVYTRRAGIPGFGSWFTNKDMAGGGCGLDIGVHALDKALFLMDYPKPATVSAVAYGHLGSQGVGTGGWGIDRAAKPQEGGRFDVEDLAYGLVRFENGTSLIVQSSWAMHLPAAELVEVYGTEGGAIIRPDKLELFQEMNGEPVTIDVEVPTGGEYSSVSQSKDLIRHLAGDETADVVTSEQAMVGIAILEAMYKSAASGSEVAL